MVDEPFMGNVCLCLPLVGRVGDSDIPYLYGACVAMVSNSKSFIVYTVLKCLTNLCGYSLLYLSLVALVGDGILDLHGACLILFTNSTLLCYTGTVLTYLTNLF